jgi:pyruvate dehydrogenase E1 component alpha subunit
MVLLRTYDERSVVYQRQGRIGTYAIFWNHEAIQAGATFALRDDDWIFPSYRESAIGLVRGLPPHTLFQWWRGHPSGWWNPADWNVASIAVPIASQIPHAAGLAWGKKLRGEDTVAMAFFGDGATSEGEFHEGVNFAAVMGAPVVFVCNNNGWAISTPLEAQTKARTLADKAAGYGIPGVTVDGMDLFAVNSAASELIERARRGDGPAYLVCNTYRFHGHHAGDPLNYREKEEVDRWRLQDPIEHVKRAAVERGVMTAAEEDELERRIAAEIDAAVEFAKNSPDPTPDQLMTDIYA